MSSNRRGKAYDGYLDHCLVTMDSHVNASLNPGSLTNNGNFAFDRHLTADPLSVCRLAGAPNTGSNAVNLEITAMEDMTPTHACVWILCGSSIEGAGNPFDHAIPMFAYDKVLG